MRAMLMCRAACSRFFLQWNYCEREKTTFVVRYFERKIFLQQKCQYFYKTAKNLASHCNPFANFYQTNSQSHVPPDYNAIQSTKGVRKQFNFVDSHPPTHCVTTQFQYNTSIESIFPFTFQWIYLYVYRLAPSFFSSSVFISCTFLSIYDSIRVGIKALA